MAITASAWPPSANFFAASGISKEPGTRTTAMLSSGAPEASSAPSAPEQQSLRNEAIEAAHDQREAKSPPRSRWGGFVWE